MGNNQELGYKSIIGQYISYILEPFERTSHSTRNFLTIYFHKFHKQFVLRDKLCSKQYTFCHDSIMAADYQEGLQEKGPFHKDDLLL